MSPNGSESILDYLRRTAVEFLDRETMGGILLMIATLLALIISNSEWSEAYEHYLRTDFMVGFENGPHLSLSIEEWINDGLMVVFFLVVGMEIKREILVGHLASTQKASMPLLAAIGGMIVPGIIYLTFNWGTDYTNGWGIPMATDIAYTLGILGLFGKLIPLQLKVFLTALAIADDMGAIMIIAFFYSSHIAWLQIGIAGLLFIVLVMMNLYGMRRLTPYIIVGVAFWLCFIHSGIHPTIAGVLFALVVPMKPRLHSLYFSKKARKTLEKLRSSDLEKDDPMTDARQQNALEKMWKDAKRSLPALLRLEKGLVGFNAYFVIPLFAFANAGVVLGGQIGEAVSGTLGLGIILGLVAGKSIGIALFSWVGHKFGLASLPEQLNWPQIIGLGFMAGIGFTMSLFITNLAFDTQQYVDFSKISILLASLIAAVIGITILLTWGRKSKIETQISE